MLIAGFRVNWRNKSDYYCHNINIWQELDDWGKVLTWHCQQLRLGTKRRLNAEVCLESNQKNLSAPRKQRKRLTEEETIIDMQMKIAQGAVVSTQKFNRK